MIGYVLRYWPTLTETFVAREIAELRRRGVDVEVIALGTRADPRPGEAVPGLVVHRPPRGLALVPTALRARPTAWLDKWALRTRWAARVVRRRRMMRLHAHFAGEAAAFARTVAARAALPFSVTVHANDLFVPRPDLGAILRDARPVVTVAHHHRSHLATRLGIDSVVVRCGVHPERYEAVDPGLATRFVCIARDVPKKGLPDLVQAMRDVPAVLRLVSDGVRYGGPRVLVGPVAAQAVPEVLATAMAFVLPCRVAENGDRDGIPVSMMEAMASGVPVITTPVSGISELVDDAVGWLVPPNDPDELSVTLQAVLADPEARRHKGALARARIVERGFTVAAQVDGLLAAWRNPR